MSSQNDYKIFPPALQLGGPLTSDQMWDGIMRMSKLDGETVMSEIEQAVNQGREMVERLGIHDPLSPSESEGAAQAEQDAGKIVSSVA